MFFDETDVESKYDLCITHNAIILRVFTTLFILREGCNKKEI